MGHYDEEYEKEAAQRNEGWNAGALLPEQFNPDIIVASTTVPQFPSTTSPAWPTPGAPVLNFPDLDPAGQEAKKIMDKHIDAAIRAGATGFTILPKLDERGMSAADRKNAPVARGVLDYFPDALLEVANLSRIGNEQHNPGQPMHWAREKSTDHADCIIRHLIDRGTLDTDGVRHAAKVAWRALALLQLEIEASRGSK